MDRDIKGYYLGFDEDEKFVAAMVDLVGHENDAAKTIKEWIDEGLTVKFQHERPDLNKFGCKL